MEFDYLQPYHNRQSFDCGNDEINHYLWQMANQHHKKDIAKTHVLLNNQTNIVEFVTLSNIMIDNTSNGLKGYPRFIGAVLIARMGVDRVYQGQGISKLLLSHALKKIKRISLDSGSAFAVIDAKDDDLANYYECLGFDKTDSPLRLIYPVNRIEC